MNDTVLYARPVPNDKFGIFFFGAGQIEVPFGNGYLCVNAGDENIWRLPATVSASETLSHTIDFGSPVGSQITAGSTWHFQAWFRDPDAGGALFNLSDGLTIPFGS